MVRLLAKHVSQFHQHQILIEQVRKQEVCPVASGDEDSVVDHGPFTVVHLLDALHHTEGHNHLNILILQTRQQPQL